MEELQIEMAAMQKELARTRAVLSDLTSMLAQELGHHNVISLLNKLAGD